MKVRPLHDRVLIKRIEEKEAAKGGHHHTRHRHGMREEEILAVLQKSIKGASR